MGSFWRDVVDGSDAARTPTRLRVAAQFFGIVGLLAAVALIVSGVLVGWTSPLTIGLLTPALGSGAASARAYHDLRRRRSGSRRK